MLNEQQKISITAKDEKCATCGSNEIDHDAQACAQQSPEKPKKKRQGPVDQLLGATVEGKYELLEVIGIGGWSKVYKSRQKGVDRFVAFKVLHSHLLADAETLARFRQEAQAAGSLQHTNITAIHDYGVLEDGRPFIVLDYMEGQTFDKVIKEQKQMPLERAVGVILQVCEGLREAHAKNIVHRDLTPANVMLLQTKDGEHVKILDFGLAKVLSPQHESATLTRTGSTVGTPAYMSPEQCRGQKIDARTDIYALGCVLYEAVTGKRAVPGESLLDCMNAHLSAEPDPLVKHRPDLKNPQQWQAVIDRALNKDPEKRYSNIDEMINDLRLLLPGKHRAGKFIARPQTAWGTASKKIKSKRHVLTVAVLSIVCVALIGIIGWRVEAIMHGAPTVKLLDLSGQANNATIGAALSGKQDTQQLNLSNCNISDEALDAVANLKGLKTLNLQGTGITETGLSKLAPLSELQELSLEKTSIHGPGLAKLGALAKLQTLNLAHTPIVDSDLKNITAIPQVTSLNLSGTTIDGAGLVYLNSTPKLIDLNLSSSALSSDGLKRLPALTNLLSLNLGSTITSDDSVAFLAKLPQLEKLSLSNTDITDKTADTISQLKSLKALDLSNCHVSDTTCFKLAKMPCLEKLNLAGTDISDEGLLQLVNLKSLKNLQVTGTHITEQGKAQLLKANPHCM